MDDWGLVPGKTDSECFDFDLGFSINLIQMNKRDVLKLMILRRPSVRLNKLHPKALQKRIQYTQPLEPLAFKLQEVPEDTAFQFKPLGVNQSIPFTVYRSWNGNLPVYRDFKNRRYVSLLP